MSNLTEARACAIGAAMVSLGCGMLPSEPAGGLQAYVGLAPWLTNEAAEVSERLDEFDMLLDNIRVVLRRADGTTAADTVVAIAPGQDSVIIEVGVRVVAAKEVLRAELELRDSLLVLFSGSESVAIARHGPASTPPPIRLDYTGPGALARRIEVAPGDTSMSMRDTLLFRAVPRTAANHALPADGVRWSVADPARGEIGTDGVFRPRGKGATYVIARLPTGVRDSVRVSVSAGK